MRLVPALRSPLARALGIALLTLAPALAFAALPRDGGRAPRAIAPVADATVSAHALRFAWQAPPNTEKHYLLVSRAPFETREWTSLPAGGDIQVIERERPIAGLDDLGIALAEDTRLYWAPAALEAGTGRLTFGPVSSNFVLRKFANQITPSPYLRTSPIGSAASRVPAEPVRIRLTAGYTLEPGGADPVIPARLRASREPGRPPRAVLVHYGDAHPDQARAAILAAGGLVVSYIPDNTFLVRVPAGRTLAVEGTASSMEFLPAYKVSPDLSIESLQPVTASILAFPDGDLDAVVAEANGAGASVVARSENGINKILRVTATGEAIAALARHDDVAWIEPYVQPELHNDLAQWVVQTGINGNRRVWDMGLRGEGQIVCTTDSGIEMTHHMFVDPLVPVPGFGQYATHRKVIAYLKGSDSPAVEFGDHPGAVFHGTHTAGTVAGTDDNAAGASPYDGMAKQAKLFFMDIGGTTLLNGVSPFNDLNDLFQPSYDGNAGGAARISSNSWGGATNGAYTLMSLNVDQFMWNHPDYLMFFSNGNSGPSGKVGSPASAKNCVGAGGTQNGTNQGNIYNSTSRGPTTDGRRKPTICSPGQAVMSATAGQGYVSLSGTSMASPSMTGAAALLRQYCTEGWYPTGTKVPANGFEPSAALLKAMCVNSADNALPAFIAPDNNVGWGRIKADNVCYFAGDTRRLLLVDNTAGLGHGQSIEYQVNVVDASQPFEVALCWTDAPPDLAAAIKLVNNLDLTVTNGVVTYKGNIYSGGFSATGGAYDDRNVEETVLVAAPAAGLWTVRIDAVAVPTGPQPFGLCITGGVGSGAGTLALDRGQYGSSGPVQIQVIDTNAGGSVSVTVSSTSEPLGETVILPGADGLYGASLPLSTVAGSAGDGVLQVSHGDEISATYVDAAPSATMTVTADVSFTTPVITNVRATNSGFQAAVVEWNTDINASSRVYYGTTPALGSQTAVDPTAATSHRMLIEGLTLGATYYYDVESVDLSGNVTRDDNGGAHYRLTVNPPGELLIVYGGEQFEREDRYTAALDGLGWSYDVWRGPLSETPTLGNLSSGLRAYRAVWWQPGLEYYPAFSDAARPVVTSYLDGGGRMAVTGHDIVWGMADPTSPYFSIDRRDWVNNTLRTYFNADPATWTGIQGIAGDPWSGGFTSTMPYAEHRTGASGDEIDVNPLDPGVYAWRNTLTPDDCGLRWESAGPLGSAGTGVWGGTPSRLAAMYFEWSGIDPTLGTSALRTNVLKATLQWLIGREKPVVALSSPNGGEVVTSSTLSIAWTESVDPSVAVGSRTIEYSPDGGSSWITVDAAAGPSPYLWDLTSVPNTTSARIRVRVTDNGTPTLSGFDASNANFSLQRTGGDLLGPQVVAGSMKIDPNPVDNQNPATLDASLSDLTTGGGTIAAAEWSMGASAAAAGSGQPMGGTFGATTVAVNATIPAMTLPTGTVKLWVRGQDAAGNWGPASSLDVTVNGTSLVGVGDENRPVVFQLRQNAPNPSRGGETEIAFGLPAPADIELRIFDLQGRQVRSLASGTREAGLHRVRWDGRDDSGMKVSPGIYWYRYSDGRQSLERRMAVLN